jgi:hypothetical protein
LKDNPNVLYGVLRSHKVFEDLGTFTLPRALREIRRIQLRKEQGQAKKTSDRESEDAGAEKARLLESEGVDQLSLSGAQDIEIGPIVFDAGGQFETEEPSPLPNSPPTERSNSLEQAIQSQSSSTPLSEKARGKLPERAASLGLNAAMNESLERIAQAGIGRNGFVPTQEWVTSWQQGLPLDTVLLTIAELLPKVQQLQSNSIGGNATTSILNFLKTANISQVLPPAPPITARRFQVRSALVQPRASLRCAL